MLKIRFCLARVLYCVLACSCLAFGSTKPLAITGPPFVIVGQKASFAVNEAGTYQWSVDGNNIGSGSVGVISPAGVYQAPQNIPAGGTVTIRCHNAQGQTASTSVAILKFLITTGPTAVALDQSGRFDVRMSSSSLQSSVNSVVGGNSSSGSINTTGIYKAAAAGPLGGGTPISRTGGNGRSAYQLVQLVGRNPKTAGPWIIRGPNEVPLGQSASFMATPSDGLQIWSVNGIAGGNSTIGTITSSGFYQAPSKMPNVGTVRIACCNSSRNAYEVIRLIGSSAGGTQPPLMTIDGPNAVVLNQSVSFIVYPAALSLTWSVNGIPGGNSSVGIINKNGVYQAPAAMPSTGIVTISCKSSAGQSASIEVTLLQRLTVSGPVSVVLGQSAAFAATAPGNTLRWSVNGILGGNASLGFIESGIYQAPQVMPPSASVTIACSDSHGQTASQTVQLVSPLTISGPATAPLGSNVSFTAIGAQVPVQWSVNSVLGGTAADGYIQNTGSYEAPLTMPGGASVVISASAPNGLSASITLSLQNPLPQLMTGQLMPSTTVSSTLTLVGTGFTNASTLLINGSPSTPSSVSQSVITAQVVASAMQAPSLMVTVSNPEPGGGSSNEIEVSTGSTQAPASITAAARLLDQATFGPSMEEIQHVRSVGLPGYLNEQFKLSPSLMPPTPSYLDLAECRPFFQCFSDGWWFKYAMWAPDQLRQKVAFTLSELWVVSYVDVSPVYLPELLNLFSRDAFGNWRTLMQDVTLSPAMGIMLNMVNSQKPGTGQEANQNYAREVMQLFNLGPVRLNQDGTLELDGSGNPIPTYNQDQIDALSRAFTGWTYGSFDFTRPCTPQTNLVQYFPNTSPGEHCPMTPVERLHDTSEKILLNGVILPAGQSAEADLSQALDDIFADPNLPPFVSRQLIQHLVKSMPSPDYVKRVADVFADDGSGVRGNMKAVITAILLDPEARADDVPGQITADGGKLREPLLWMISLMRALDGKNVSPTTMRQFGGILGEAGSIGEEVHNSADVFNYFSPYFVVPGTTLNAPEFELETPTSFPIEQLFAQQIVNGQLNQIVAIDCGAGGTLGNLAAIDPNLLIEYLNIVMLHGSMSDEMRSIVYQAIQGADPARMVRMAVFLVSTSPQYKVMN